MGNLNIFIVMTLKLIDTYIRIRIRIDLKMQTNKKHVKTSQCSLFRLAVSLSIGMMGIFTMKNRKHEILGGIKFLSWCRMPFLTHCQPRTSEGNNSQRQTRRKGGRGGRDEEDRGGTEWLIEREGGGELCKRK